LPRRDNLRHLFGRKLSLELGELASPVREEVRHAQLGTPPEKTGDTCFDALNDSDDIASFDTGK
jgi:hypothetical protein